MKLSRLPLFVLAAAALFSIACSPESMPTSASTTAVSAPTTDGGTMSAQYIAGQDIAIIGPAPCFVKAAPTFGGYSINVGFCTYAAGITSVDANLTTMFEELHSLQHVGEYGQGCRVVSMRFANGLKRYTWIRLQGKLADGRNLTSDRCAIMY